MSCRKLDDAGLPIDEDDTTSKTSNDNETNDAGSHTRPFVRNVIDVFEADGEIRAARYR